MRTSDTGYGEDYFESLDNGLGYVDSTLWEDIAHAIKEVFGISDGTDISGEVNVCDVGCAKGYLVRHLRRRGFDAWGVDISTYALESAPDDVKQYLRWQDLTQPHGSFFGTEQFRLVTCFETMEHIPKVHVPRALGHIHDLLMPGGKALLTICVEGQPDTLSDPTHVTIKPWRWWENQLRNAGFGMWPELEHAMRRFWLFSQHKGVFVVERTR